MINELIMLPIKYPSKLAARGFAYMGGLYYMEFEFIKSANYFPQHLYILSEDIKENNDLCLCLDEIRSNTLPENKNNQISPFVSWLTTNNCNGCRKIIASTDPSLKLPVIPKSFIEYFISEWNIGNKIEKVNVVYDLFWNNRRFKHQPFPDEFATEKDRVYELKINPDNTITINI